ncbi:unnamed protein product [Lactuca saligna]|uniref:Protein kinase domain-containing protein n=1 Tax=Lactuca saligna TaxID=75948 RepID=A0AA36EHJ3_LACSI|nr:unnamed protein product [Lactuca saligna]
MSTSWICSFLFGFFLILSFIASQPDNLQGTTNLSTTWTNNEPCIPSINYPDGSRIRVVLEEGGSFVLFLILVVGFTTFILQKKKRGREMEEEHLDQVTGMPTRFSYQELKTATDNFSKKLGQGGFGSVFQGTLEDGSQIAVKCLQGLGHVKKSFLAEVESIGSIHHVNLLLICRVQETTVEHEKRSKLYQGQEKMKCKL